MLLIDYENGYFEFDSILLNLEIYLNFGDFIYFCYKSYVESLFLILIGSLLTELLLTICIPYLYVEYTKPLWINSLFVFIPKSLLFFCILS